MAKQKIDDLAVVLSASSDQLAGDLRAAAKLLDGFKKKLDSQDAGGSALKRTSNELQAQKKAAAEASAAWRAVARAKDHGLRNAVVTGLTTTGSMIAAKAVASATGGVFDQLKDSVNLAAELEKTSLAFEVMVGSAKEGEKALNSFREMAKETPFGEQEIIGSGRKLMAGGLSPGQALANLKMLGDISAGTQTKIEDLSLVYSKMLAQGRLYTEDVNQFAERNIPIYGELAKVLGVAKEEVRAMVEAGKVGIPEVQKAFKNLTSEGGRFANLMARQADTYAGVREQLSDAWDMLKTRLGQVLIEQLGLKAGAKDMEAFVKRVEEGIPRIERFVRFVGSLGRSVATVASQFLQAAAEAARFSDQLLDDAFPEMRKALQEFADWVESGKEFRIRPEFVLEGVIAAGRGVMTFFRDFLQALKDVGETINDYILLPIRRAFTGMLRNWAEIKGLVRDDVPAAELYSPPAFFERDDRIVKNFRKLWDEYSKLELTGAEARARELDLSSRNERFLPNEPPPLTPDEIGPEQAKVRARKKELLAARDEFVKVFDLPPLEAQHKLYIEGVVPNMPSRGDSVLGAGGGLQRRITGTESALQRWDALGERMKGELALKRAAEESANSIYALGGGALFAGKALAKIDAERNAIVAGAGGLAMVGRDLKAQKVLPREELAPFAAPGERIDRVQLPDAALRDTEAAVRIINMNMAANSGEQRPLNMIERHTAATATGIMDLLRKLNMPPIIDPPK